MDGNQMVSIRVAERTATLLDEFCQMTHLDRDAAADILLWQKLVDYMLTKTVTEEEANRLKDIIIPKPDKK